MLIAKAKQKAHDDIADTVLATLPCWLNQSFSSKHVTFNLAFWTSPQLKLNSHPLTKQETGKNPTKPKQQITAVEIQSLILVSLSLMTTN